MSDLFEEVLKHRYIYVPRGEVKDSLTLGKKLGLAVARMRRAPLTVLTPQKSGATHHAELAELTIVTERSGHVADGGLVLAWCPRFKTMEKLQHLERSTIVLVEWIPGEMEPWAKVMGAYNVATGEVMDPGLSPEAHRALEGIVYEGYKGWTDDISARGVRDHLEDLQAAGAYDRSLMLAYARQTESETAIQRLEKILDKFEAATTRPGEMTTPRRLELDL